MKILYNITTIVDHTAKEQWLDFVTNDIIPFIKATKLFEDIKLVRIIDREYNPDGVSFAIQLYAESFADCRTYELDFLPILSAKEQEYFAGKIASFSTFMEILV
jgi:hypothetical protein